MKSHDRLFKISFVVAVLLLLYTLCFELAVLLAGLHFINPVPPGTHWAWKYNESAVHMVRLVTTVIFVPASIMLFVLAIRNRSRKSRKVAWAVLAFAVATLAWTLIATELTSSSIVSGSSNSHDNSGLRILEIKAGD